MKWKKHVLGAFLRGTLVILGIVTVLFISNFMEWRFMGSEDEAEFDRWTTSSHTVDLWGIGEVIHNGTFSLVVMGLSPEGPYVLFGGAPRARIYDQNGTLIASIVPPQNDTLADGIDVLSCITIGNPGFYTFVLDDVYLQTNCWFALLGYPDTLVYPYWDLRPLGVGLIVIGATAICVVIGDAAKTLRK